MRKLLAIAAALALPAAALALPASGLAGPATPTVKVADPPHGFKPSSLSVPHGTKVHFVWTGVLYHNVTFKTGPRGVGKFHSPSQIKGSWTHLFTVKGTYVLYCTFHRFTVKVIVK